MLRSGVDCKVSLAWGGALLWYLSKNDKAGQAPPIPQGREATQIVRRASLGAQNFPVSSVNN